MSNPLAEYLSALAKRDEREKASKQVIDQCQCCWAEQTTYRTSERLNEFRYKTRRPYSTERSTGTTGSRRPSQSAISICDSIHFTDTLVWNTQAQVFANASGEHYFHSCSTAHRASCSTQDSIEPRSPTSHCQCRAVRTEDDLIRPKEENREVRKDQEGA